MSASIRLDGAPTRGGRVFEVVACAKRGSVCGQNDYTHGRILTRCVKGRTKCAKHRLGQRIAALHIVQRQAQNAIIAQVTYEDIARRTGAAPLAKLSGC